ncbi:MAG TPA: ROK family protein [Candidatus Eisenbacteria bacterium]
MAERYAIGLDLGGTDLKAGLVTPAGTVEAFTRRPSRTHESAEAPLEVIVAAAEKLRSRAGARAPIGLGCPGAIEPASGALLGTTPHLPHWDSMPLRERMAERLGGRLVVDNDANCAALAEARVGAARGARVSVTLTLGTGIGCGIVVDGRIVHGASGGAGEIGHLPLGSGERPCRCGVERCVEPEASASGLLASARAAGLRVSEAAEVFAAAAQGDPVATRLVDRMADRLGAVIAVAINLLNPDVVAVGGGVSRAGEPLFARLRSAVDRYSLASHRRALHLLPAALGERSGTVGAGLLAWEAETGSRRTRARPAASRAGRALSRSGPASRPRSAGR